MVEPDAGDSGETAGGYAKEMSADYQKRQAELVAEHIAKQDIVICTALIPGRPAPELVTRKMVESMKPGSVIVDLAVEQGGNCKLSKPGKIVEHKGVALIGHQNVPGRLAGNASELYARNILNFIDAFFDKDKKQLAIDWEDEIVLGIGLTRGGEIVHEALAPPAKPAAAKKPAAKKAAKSGTTKRKTAARNAAKKPAPRKRTAKGAK
jgi:NAD(P) transhydrogenase subunit alpha